MIDDPDISFENINEIKFGYKKIQKKIMYWWGHKHENKNTLKSNISL